MLYLVGLFRYSLVGCLSSRFVASSVYDWLLCDVCVDVCLRLYAFVCLVSCVPYLCVFCIFVFSGVCTIGCGASLWRLCVGAASRSVRFLCLPVVWWLICGFPLSVSLTSYSTPPFVLAISLLLSVLS